MNPTTQVARALLIMSGVLMMALGCALALEKDKFPYATVAPSCAPWDGPATELHFSSSPLKCGQGDLIEMTVSFWRDLPLHDGQTFTINAKSNWGGASYCKEGHQPCERATIGSIHIESISPDKGAKGTYDLTFPKLGRVIGSFQADWCKMRVMCG